MYLAILLATGFGLWVMKPSPRPGPPRRYKDYTDKNGVVWINYEVRYGDSANIWFQTRDKNGYPLRCCRDQSLEDESIWEWYINYGSTYGSKRYSEPFPAMDEAEENSPF